MVRKIVSVACLLALGVALMAAKAPQTGNFTKQNGGSTGDSSTVAPDTAEAWRLDRNADKWFINVSCDSFSSYRTQVSLDGTRWFTVDFDSCPSGTSEAGLTSTNGALFQDGIFANYYIRVILDNLTAAGAPFGRSTIVWQER